MLYLLLFQATAPAEPKIGCLTALITWAPIVVLVVFFAVMVRRMGYFSKKGGYMNRSLEHMDRVEQTLTKIEEHLRTLVERTPKE